MTTTTTTTTVTVTVCKPQRITYSKKYVPEITKKYYKPVKESQVIEIVTNKKRPFTRISDTIVKVNKKG